MTEISRQRCTLHPEREAAALCLECHRYFCRECITEHDGRVVCSQCLAQMAAAKKTVRFRAARFYGAFQLLLGVLILWGLFYYLGQTLISVPSAFHDGTLWDASFWNAP